MQTCAKEEKNFAKENYFEVNCLPARQRAPSVFAAVSAAFTFLRRLSLAFIPLNRALTQAPLSCLSGCSCTARNAWAIDNAIWLRRRQVKGSFSSSWQC